MGDETPVNKDKHNWYTVRVINKKSSGFTIVELLIVIVVIGILASISLVAYGGIQQRARNSARLLAARQVTDVVRLASVSSSMMEMRATMQLSGGWYSACLGINYKDVNADGRGDCGVYNGSPYVSESSALNALLSKAVTLPSMSSYPVMAMDGDVLSGPFIGSAWVDEKDMLVVEYSLEGEKQNCTLSPLVYYTSTGGRTLTTAASPPYSKSEYGVTECIVAVHQ